MPPPVEKPGPDGGLFVYDPNMQRYMKLPDEAYRRYLQVDAIRHPK